MLKGIISAVIGTRHDRERRKIQPIVDEINEEYARLQNVSEEDLRGQTAKLRGIIRERTGELEARVASLREAKRAAAVRLGSSKHAVDNGHQLRQPERPDQVVEPVDHVRGRIAVQGVGA